jgi:hypothetical protein
MRGAKVAVVAIFTAMIVSSDFALSGFSNVKLLDTLVFVSAYVFGFQVGALVGVLSETVWSFFSPYGNAGAIAPFLILGELLFALAGWTSSKVWGPNLKLGSPYPLFIGSLLTICAFLWDFETNVATALLAYGPIVTPPVFWLTVFGPLIVPFYIAHEGTDLIFGTILVPIFIQLIPKTLRRES